MVPSSLDSVDGYNVITWGVKTGLLSSIIMTFALTFAKQTHYQYENINFKINLGHIQIF